MGLPILPVKPVYTLLKQNILSVNNFLYQVFYLNIHYGCHRSMNNPCSKAISNKNIKAFCTLLLKAQDIE